MEHQIRSQEEIVQRIRDIQSSEEDMFGFRVKVLAPALTWENVKEFMKEDAEKGDWQDGITAQDAFYQASAYYFFAIEKIVNHRGLSAFRSVEKLSEYAWLLCRDDIVDLMADADYENYGAPKIKVFGEGLGLGWPTMHAIVNMAAGEPCEPGCESGCGS